MLSLVQFSHALADPTRWRIVVQTTERQLCVCELVEGLELPQSTLSSHLAVLKKAGLLEVEKRGKWAYYRTACKLKPLINAMAAQFPDALKNKQVKADTRRVKARIALRGTSHCGTGGYRAIPPATAI